MTHRRVLTTAVMAALSLLSPSAWSAVPACNYGTALSWYIPPPARVANSGTQTMSVLTYDWTDVQSNVIWSAWTFYDSSGNDPQGTTFIDFAREPEDSCYTPAGYCTSTWSNSMNIFTSDVYTLQVTTPDVPNAAASCIEASIVIQNLPTAAIGAGWATTGEVTDFAGSGTIDPNAANPSLTYSWDFGDGTQSTTQNPTHTYSAGGTYTVTLTTNDGYFTSTTATGQVTVNGKDVSTATVPVVYAALGD